MAKKVIQVPVDEGLLKELDTLANKQRKARAEVIREACQLYIVQVESEESDRVYQKGYLEIPEGPEMGEAQVDMMSEALPGESW